MRSSGHELATPNSGLDILAQCHQGEEANLSTSTISYLGYATTNTIGYLDYLASCAQLQSMSHRSVNLCNTSLRYTSEARHNTSRPGARYANKWGSTYPNHSRCHTARSLVITLIFNRWAHGAALIAVMQSLLFDKGHVWFNDGHYRLRDHPVLHGSAASLLAGCKRAL